uniref:Uncharacterized protein n=1 Tax=Panagrolaimus sp. JU765 TaxID=591449 RepID=A0AC34RFP5_9BILA
MWTVTNNRIISMLENELKGASDVYLNENLSPARNTPISRKRKSTEGAVADETPRFLKGMKKPFADVNDDKEIHLLE